MVVELRRSTLLLAAPVLLWQGRAVRRDTPRLPDARDRSGGVGLPTASGSSAPTEEPIGPAGAAAETRSNGSMRVVMVGDSVAAGVGVDSHVDTIPGVIARVLHGRIGRPVTWDVVAKSGADSGRVARLIVERGEAVDGADLVVVSIGVNDVKDLRTDAAWTAGVRAVLDAVIARAPAAALVLLGLPPVERFPALPRPLADLLGARARRMDRLAGDVARAYPQVTRLSLEPSALAEVAHPFAADGFHPSAELHGFIAARIAELDVVPG